MVVVFKEVIRDWVNTSTSTKTEHIKALTTVQEATKNGLLGIKHYQYWWLKTKRQFEQGWSMY